MIWKVVDARGKPWDNIFYRLLDQSVTYQSFKMIATLFPISNMKDPESATELSKRLDTFKAPPQNPLVCVSEFYIHNMPEVLSIKTHQTQNDKWDPEAHRQEHQLESGRFVIATILEVRSGEGITWQSVRGAAELLETNPQIGKMLESSAMSWLGLNSKRVSVRT